MIFHNKQMQGNIIFIHASTERPLNKDRTRSVVERIRIKQRPIISTTHTAQSSLVRTNPRSNVIITIIIRILYNSYGNQHWPHKLSASASPTPQYQHQPLSLSLASSASIFTIIHSHLSWTEGTGTLQPTMIGHHKCPFIFHQRDPHPSHHHHDHHGSSSPIYQHHIGGQQRQDQQSWLISLSNWCSVFHSYRWPET